MEYDRISKKLRVSGHGWSLLTQIAAMKSATEFPEPGRWRQFNDEFLWQSIVGQIMNRGGTAWHERLVARGQKDAYESALSLKELKRLSAKPPSEADLYRYVRQQLEKFYVGRFREDNARSVVVNFGRLVDAHKGVKLRKQLCKFDCLSASIGPEVQFAERAVRSYLIEKMVFFQRSKSYHVKRKPPSDLLIHLGFARTLMAFDTRMKKAFREAFGLLVSEKNYEPIEDWFVGEAYPKLQVTPSEFDRIIFQNLDMILTLAKHPA